MESFELLMKGLELANQKGAYTLSDANALFQAANVVKRQLESIKEGQEEKKELPQSPGPITDGGTSKLKKTK